MHVNLCTEGGEVVEEFVDLLLERGYVCGHMLESAPGQPSAAARVVPKPSYSSESLKLLQQLGAYKHSRLRLPQRWHGVCPLHLILRRLHSLLPAR